MAKVKKMAFGGMGGRMIAPKPSVGVGMAAPKPPAGFTPPTTLSPYTQSGAQATMPKPSGDLGKLSNMVNKLSQAGPATGGNQAPAGANLMQGYGAFAAPDVTKLLGANAQKPAAGGITGTGNTQQDAYSDYMKQMNAAGNKPPVGANSTQVSSAPPAFKSLGGIGAGMKKGGKVKAKAYAKGGTVSSASKRGDGIAQRGKTKGRMV